MLFGPVHGSGFDGFEASLPPKTYVWERTYPDNGSIWKTLSQRIGSPSEFVAEKWRDCLFVLPCGSVASASFDYESSNALLITVRVPSEEDSIYYIKVDPRPSMPRCSSHVPTTLDLLSNGFFERVARGVAERACAEKN